MEEEKKKRRIGNMQGALMIGVALTIDGVQVLLDMVFIGLILGSFISIFAWMMFWFWFKLNGVSFLKGKTALLRLATISGAGIIELIPVINDIPTWAFAVGIMFITVMLEDEAQKMGISNMLSPNKLLRRNKRRNTNKNDRIRRSKQMSLA